VKLKTLTSLSVTPLVAYKDASLRAFFFCERKKPDQPPDNATQGMQYGQKETVALNFRLIFIIRNFHFASNLFVNILVCGLCLREIYSGSRQVIALGLSSATEKVDNRQQDDSTQHCH
jgi:hypothetical protein